MKKKDQKQYKFINNETDNIIFFLTIPEDEPDPEKILEETRQKLAVENGIYIGNVHYITVSDHEFDE
ncbi:hypothetical protein KXQ82_06645 [Mucilaginibacter sp. HMF5004]|uniref:hypothetical protein n=1 Tax=Mucilaginibacter rivuli TaxID=2857527 RepID=UPI001C5FF7A6|nr:hypothetical protein [Mucilaginibacter rivuli]MBW4889384.1 hypothetical protein [Mucilaginibacter rivuli]